MRHTVKENFFFTKKRCIFLKVHKCYIHLVQELSYSNHNQKNCVSEDCFFIDVLLFFRIKIEAGGLFFVLNM